jgi:hypothetical protein
MCPVVKIGLDGFDERVKDFTTVDQVSTVRRGQE